jgi:hypothetical protein
MHIDITIKYPQACPRRRLRVSGRANLGGSGPHTRPSNLNIVSFKVLQFHTICNIFATLKPGRSTAFSIGEVSPPERNQPGWRNR